MERKVSPNLRVASLVLLKSNRPVDPGGRILISGASAYGEVYNLKKLHDFNGHYHAGGAGNRGVTLASGRSATAMTNQAGVTVLLSSTQRGVDVNLGGAGVDMAIKK